MRTTRPRSRLPSALTRLVTVIGSFGLALPSRFLSLAEGGLVLLPRRAEGSLISVICHAAEDRAQDCRPRRGRLCISIVANPAAHGTAPLLLCVQESAGGTRPKVACGGAKYRADDALVSGLAAEQVELEIRRWHRCTTTRAAALQREDHIRLHGQNEESSCYFSPARTAPRPLFGRSSQQRARVF